MLLRTLHRVMAGLQIILLVVSASVVLGQRPSFAGFRPIGYPELEKPSTEGLGNRFGDGTTERLPVEAKGDRELVERLSKLPIDKQPFWFINWKIIEANRGKPQSYPLRPNPFLDDPIPAPSGNSGLSGNTASGGITASSGNTATSGNSEANTDLDTRSGGSDIKNGGEANTGSASSKVTDTPEFKSNHDDKQSVYSSSKTTAAGKS